MAELFEEGERFYKITIIPDDGGEEAGGLLEAEDDGELLGLPGASDALQDARSFEGDLQDRLIRETLDELRSEPVTRVIVRDPQASDLVIVVILVTAGVAFLSAISGG